MSDRIFYISEVTAKPGMFESVVSALNDMAKRVLAEEPGVIFYEFYADEANGKVFAHEGYDSSESLIAHFTGEIAAAGVPAVLEAGDMTGFTVYGDPSPEAAEMLAGYGAVIHRRVGGFTR